MGRKKAKSHKRRQRRLTVTQRSIDKRRWMLTIGSKEAAVNFYSILVAFQRAGGGGLINEEALKYVAEWIEFIS